MILAFKNLKNHTIFKSARYLTDKQIEIMNDHAFSFDNTVKSNDQIKLLLAKNKLFRLYYRAKINIKSCYIYQKAGFILVLFLI